ncbi:MAG: TetR/AcrR family transcriptional regulator [Gammaproteobacteria bacterium]|nr:TetR/AcrR family transcriptional regulator [Gammaproteobacteria bacterium]
MGVAERREREREARKTSVLDAARSLLLERGFTGTTTKQIAEYCELSEATLFFYFKNKDEIFLSLLFEGIEYWEQGLDKIQKLNISAEKRLRRIWKFFQDVESKHPEYYLLSANLARPQATSDISPEIKEQIIRRSGANFQRLAELLEETTGRSDGRIMADAMWSAFLGLTVLRESRQNLDSGRHPTKRDFDRVLEILSKGLLQDGKGATR